MDFKKKIKRARKNTGKEVKCLIGSSIEHDNKDKDQNTSNPTVKYRQGNKQLCFPNSLCSALFYLRQKSNNQQLHDLIQDIQGQKDPLGEKSIINHVKECMDRAKWSVKNITKALKKITLDLFIKFVRENENTIFVVQLGTDNMEYNHWVAVVNNFIFDSNRENSDILSKDGLDSCCAGVSNFYKFKKIYEYQAPQVISNTKRDSEKISQNEKEDKEKKETKKRKTKKVKFLSPKKFFYEKGSFTQIYDSLTKKEQECIDKIGKSGKR